MAEDGGVDSMTTRPGSATALGLKKSKSRRLSSLRDLQLHKGRQPPTDIICDAEPINRESDGDAWCRKMREGDQHMEELRIDSKFDD